MVRRVIQFTVAKLWLALAILLVLAALALSAIRYTLPYLDNYRQTIENLIAEYSGQEVRIGALAADWSAFGPSLVLEDVEFSLDDSYPFELKIARTHLVLNLWQSLWNREWQLEDFVAEGVRFELELDLTTTSGGDLELVDAMEQFLLNQLEQFQVINSEVLVYDAAGTERRLFIEQLSWSNRSSVRQGTGRFRVSEVTANNLNFILNAEGNSFAEMHGEFYLQADDLDLSPWLEAAIPGVAITQAQLNVNAWLNFDHGQFGQAQVHFGENSLQWQRDGETHELVSSPVAWGMWPQSDGFAMNSEALTIRVNETEWPVESISWRMADSAHIWNLYELSFSEVAPLWSLFGSPGLQIRDWLAEMRPAGVLNDVQVRLDRDLQWSFFVNADDIRWQPHRAGPGLEGLNFKLWSDLSAGAFELSGKQVAVASPITFTDARQLSDVAWSGYWTRLENGWRVAMPHARARMADIVFEQQFSLTREYGDSPVIEWWMEGVGAQLQVAGALDFLPLQIGTQLNDYLRNAIQGGEVNRLNVLWRGDIDGFPYYHNDGTFVARLLVDELDFKFQPDWPAVEKTALTLEFRDHDLNFSARGGTLLGAELIEVEAQIPDIVLPEPWLLIDAKAKGSGQEAFNIFTQSPLADSVGATLQQLTSNDLFNGEFSIRIPLFAGEEDKNTAEPSVASPQVQGQVDFTGQSLYLTPLDLDIKNIQGALSFNNSEISMRGISAHVFNLPIQVDMDGDTASLTAALRERAGLSNTDSGYQLDVRINSAWDDSILEDSEILSWLAPHVSGELESTTDFRILLAGGYFDYSWNMRNVINELAVNLPYPLQKDSGDAVYLDIDVEGNENALEIGMQWPEVARFAAELTLGKDEFNWALLQTGNAVSYEVPSPEYGTSLQLELDTFDAGAWLALYGLMAGNVNGEGQGLPWALPAVNYVQADIGQMSLLNQTFHNAQWQGGQVLDVNTLQLNSDEARMSFTMPITVAGGEELSSTNASSLLNIKIDYLNLQKFTRQGSEESEEAKPYHSRPDGEFFDQLPAFRLECEFCRYDGTEIGRIEMLYDPSFPNEQVRNLHIRRNGAEVDLTGGWQSDGENYVSSVTGWMAIADVGLLAADFGSSSVVRDSSGQVEFDLSWVGSPAQFSLANLNGTLDWRLGDGYLRDVSDGGARLFSLFSLESLMRKLTLDFRDIFARGMFYSSFRGTLDINDGIVYTHNTRMNGSAGDMEVSGSTNLLTEEVNYDLVYVPKVTSSLPVLVAWMVNPPTGLAALLIDRVLHDAQVISRLEYSIGGTLSEPTVQETGRAQREVELPEVKFDQLPEEENGPN